jgi:predicted kinase
VGQSSAAEENISRGVDVIIESPFHFENDREIFEVLKSKYSVELYTIVLELEATERKKRFTERDRHPSHYDTARATQYEEAASTYEHMPEPKLFLDSRNTLDDLVKEAIEFIA